MKLLSQNNQLLKQRNPHSPCLHLNHLHLTVRMNMWMPNKKKVTHTLNHQFYIQDAPET